MSASLGTQVAPAVEPIKVLAGILQNQMALGAGQIMLGFENWEIPETPGLYVYLAYGSEQVIGNNNTSALDSEGNFVEVQQCVMLHQVVIDVLSFDSSARLRKEGVLWALASQYAQNEMELNGMRIASTPGSFTTITSPEPSKQLNRFQLGIEVYAMHQNDVAAPYFDSLQPVALTVDA